MTWPELQKKYGHLAFDTLVADCEAALYYILQDAPEMLTRLRTVIMENDYAVLEEKKSVDAALTKAGFRPVYYAAGGWGPCRSNFFEVWSRV